MTQSRAGAPQARKLGLRPGQRTCLDHAPPGWALSEPPEGLLRANSPDQADLVVSFFTASDQLPQRLPQLVRAIFPDGALWVAWPRRAGGHQSDLTDSLVRRQALPLGVVDVKVAAIDRDWSGLKLVWRRGDRGAS